MAQVGEAEERAAREVRGEPEALNATPNTFHHRPEDYADFVGSAPSSWLANRGGSERRAWWIQRKGELGYLGEGWEEAVAQLQAAARL